VEAKLRELFKSIRQINGEEDVAFKVNETVSSLFDRSANLFYFYQTGDPFEQLNMQDYGHHEYEKFKNYLTHSKAAHRVSKKQVAAEGYDEYLRPIFEKRSELILFDAFVKLSNTFLHVDEMKIRKPAVMGAVCKKLSKHLLKHYDYIWGTSKEEMRCQILENTRAIMSIAKEESMRKSAAAEEPKFIKRYTTGHKVATIINSCIDYLEKDR
jgi:hypothetical protein